MVLSLIPSWDGESLRREPLEHTKVHSALTTLKMVEAVLGKLSLVLLEN